MVNQFSSHLHNTLDFAHIAMFNIMLDSAKCFKEQFTISKFYHMFIFQLVIL